MARSPAAVLNRDRWKPKVNSHYLDDDEGGLFVPVALLSVAQCHSSGTLNWQSGGGAWCLASNGGADPGQRDKHKADHVEGEYGPSEALNDRQELACNR